MAVNTRNLIILPQEGLFNWTTFTKPTVGNGNLFKVYRNGSLSSLNPDFVQGFFTVPLPVGVATNINQAGGITSIMMQFRALGVAPNDRENFVIGGEWGVCFLNTPGANIMDTFIIYMLGPAASADPITFLPSFDDWEVDTIEYEGAAIDNGAIEMLSNQQVATRVLGA